MYPQSQGGGWNSPNAQPATNHHVNNTNDQVHQQPGQQQQPPQQWASRPPTGQYPQQQPQTQQLPSMSSQSMQQPPQPAPAMQTLQPNPHDPYRLPPPQQMYPPPYQQMGYPPAQTAPRQRTAIACRYCRRRKIRCSGFDQSEDGRCTNCQRFSQECVFTPVSAQTQTFVPAHTAWRGGQNPPQNLQLYGAYGQPLPQHGNREGYPPQQQPQQLPQQPQQPQQQQGQYPGPPQGYQQQPMYQQDVGRKRTSDEPHTPTLPPPAPGQMHDGAQNDGDDRRRHSVKDAGVQVELLK